MITIDSKKIKWAINYNEKPKTKRDVHLTEENCKLINAHDEITIIHNSLNLF